MQSMLLFLCFLYPPPPLQNSGIVLPKLYKATQTDDIFLGQSLCSHINVYIIDKFHICNISGSSGLVWNKLVCMTLNMNTNMFEMRDEFQIARGVQYTKWFSAKVPNNFWIYMFTQDFNAKNNMTDYTLDCTLGGWPCRRGLLFLGTFFSHIFFLHTCIFPLCFYEWQSHS